MLTRRDDSITDNKTTLSQRHRGGAAVRTSTAHPTQETAGGVLQNRRTAGSRLPTELQTTTGEDGCRTPAAGWGTPTWTSRTEEHRRGRSIRWSSFLPTRLPLTGGEDRTTSATPAGETRTFATVATPTAGPSRSSIHKTKHTPRKHQQPTGRITVTLQTTAE